MHPVIFSTITNRSASGRFNVLSGQDQTPIKEVAKCVQYCREALA